MANPVLVLDLGSSSLRASLVGEAGTILHEKRQSIPALTPADGIVEFDPLQIIDAALGMADDLISTQPISAIGITDHRASTMIWERKTGKPFGNMISWQDIRTVFACLELQAQGLRLLPNQSATKLQHLLAQVDEPEKYCFGTPESWLAWNLSQGELHVCDATHAGVTGLIQLDGSNWDSAAMAILGMPEVVLPQIVDSLGVIGEASALKGSPPIAGLIGDQQASLLGQGCIKSGQAKITFGTSAMLDVCMGNVRPKFELRGENGTFPIIAWRENGENIWGIEAAMLNAGSALDWACQKAGLAESAADLEPLSSTSSNGVKFVPALVGLGTPYWDFGSRGTFLGMHLGIEKGDIIRAVLEGIANHGADLIHAGEQDSTEFKCLRVDGGMSQNHLFLQALADASGKQLEISAEVECTSLGAAYLAGTAVGVWESLEETASLYKPKHVIEPDPRSEIRDGWAEAVESASNWHPDLSTIEF